MILLLTKTKVVVLSSKKKVEFLTSVLKEDDLGGGNLPTSLMELTRDKSDKDAKNFTKLLDVARSAGKVRTT